MVFSYALTMFNPGWESSLQAAIDSLAPGGTLAVLDFHDTGFPAFREWMRLNHVRVEGHLLPWLRQAFPESTEVQVQSAFFGLWLYFSFTATRAA